MPEVISFSQDMEKPGKNPIASEKGIRAVNSSIDNRNLKATIKRINRVQEREKTLQEEGQRIGEAIQERGNTVDVLVAEKTKQLIEERTTARENSPKSNPMETIFIDTETSRDIEAGKGEKVDNSA